VSKSDQQWEFLRDLSLLIAYADRMGYKLTGGELERPQAMQDIYWKEGKTTVRRSVHQDRKAVDLNVFKGGEYTTLKIDVQPLGDFWESLSPLNSWGGNWHSFCDTPHFERRDK